MSATDNASPQVPLPSNTRTVRVTLTPEQRQFCKTVGMDELVYAQGLVRQEQAKREAEEAMTKDPPQPGAITGFV